jgi:hypothetical protein
MKKITTTIIFMLTGILISFISFAQTPPMSEGHTELEPGSGIWVNEHFIQAKMLESENKPLEAADKYIESVNYEGKLQNASWWCYERSLSNAGQIYYDNKQYKYALHVMLPLLEYYQKTKSWDSYVRVGEAVAYSYTLLGSYQDAINTWWVIQKIVKAFTNDNDPNGLKSRGAALKSIGVNFEYWEKYDSAAYYYQKSIDLNKRANNQEEANGIQEALDRVNKKL